MMEITILRGDPSPRYRSPDGTEHTSRGDACRAMIAEGMAPATPVVFRWHTGMASSVPLPIAYWAARTCLGGDSDPAVTWWRPHPHGNYPDELLRWHAETAAERAAARVVAESARKALAVAV